MSTAAHAAAAGILEYTTSSVPEQAVEKAASHNAVLEQRKAAAVALIGQIFPIFFRFSLLQVVLRRSRGKKLAWKISPSCQKNHLKNDQNSEKSIFSDIFLLCIVPKRVVIHVPRLKK